MTQEEKNLLLKDLCAILPYGVKIQVNNKIEILEGIGIPDNVVEYDSFLSCEVGEVKPYLFPLSSMTDKQKREYNFLKYEVLVCHYEYGDVVNEIELYDSSESFEYLIENHFDYRALIERELAVDATGLNIY